MTLFETPMRNDALAGAQMRKTSGALLRAARRSVQALTATLACGLIFAASAQTPANRTLETEAGVDASIKPGDDFFAYANGAWLKRTKMPPGKEKLTSAQKQLLRAWIDGGARGKDAPAPPPAPILSAVLAHSSHPPQSKVAHIELPLSRPRPQKVHQRP